MRVFFVIATTLFVIIMADKLLSKSKVLGTILTVVLVIIGLILIVQICTNQITGVFYIILGLILGYLGILLFRLLANW